jgi:hypothetical protein
LLAEILTDFQGLYQPLHGEAATQATANGIATLANAIQAATRRGKPARGQIAVPIPRNQGIHPPQTLMTGAEMSFAFNIPTLDRPIEVEDLFCEVQVCVRGRLQLDVGVVALEDHWRIDTQEKPDAQKPPREGHPLFHYQRGGHAQDRFAGEPGFVPGPAIPAAQHELRGLMQYPGPRIAVIPMCPTSALDLVISQHDGPLWRRLMGRPEYANTVERCHDRIWAMYLGALADAKRRRVLLRAC